MPKGNYNHREINVCNFTLNVLTHKYMKQSHFFIQSLLYQYDYKLTKFKPTARNSHKYLTKYDTDGRQIYFTDATLRMWALIFSQLLPPTRHNLPPNSSLLPENYISLSFYLPWSPICLVSLAFQVSTFPKTVNQATQNNYCSQCRQLKDPRPINGQKK